MNSLEAFILGIIQGLSEFLPISSSGHLELGKVIMGIEAKESLLFTVVVHGATVLSTLVIFRKDIWKLIQGFFQFKWNEETKYISKIAISMIPIGIVGLFFKDAVEALFDGNLVLVGAALLATALLLAFTYYAKEREKTISFSDALLIGIAQAFAVLPGLSRSGSTIATGLLLGNRRHEVSKFSFLMVLAPIIGANIKDILDYSEANTHTIGAIPLLVGFITAFLVGLVACKLMIKLVNKGKLIWFALYCALVGITALGTTLL